MSRTNEPELRQCPTRTDGGDPLICHLIDVATCQRRQRGRYHKCPTCAYQNGGMVERVNVLPPRREPVQPREPAPEHPSAPQREPKPAASPAPRRVQRAGKAG